MGADHDRLHRVHRRRRRPRLAEGCRLLPLGVLELKNAEELIQLRVLVKRILRKHGYPPDKQEKATQTVLEQAALLSAEWAMAA